MYDKTHKDYKDTVKRWNSWEDIASAFAVEEETISVGEISKRWGQLRDRYRKIRNELVNGRLPSGASRADAEKKKVKWQHLSSMDALLQTHEANRDGGDSFTLQSQAEDSENGRVLIDADDIISVHFGEGDSQATIFDTQLSSQPSTSDVSRDCEQFTISGAYWSTRGHHCKLVK